MARATRLTMASLSGVTLAAYTGPPVLGRVAGTTRAKRRQRLLTGGDKSGDWQGWYRKAIPHAEEVYAEYLKEREAEEGR